MLRPILAACLIAAALLMKVLVPTGYMPTASAGAMTIEVCTGYGVQKMVVTPDGEHGDDGGAAESPCAFAGLSAPSLAATDPLVLALAIAFVMAASFRAVAAGVLLAPPFLRPPLRGPPAHS